MKTKFNLFISLAFLTSVFMVAAQGTAFTYQGRLNNGGTVANGSYDLLFTLYNTNVSGAVLAGPVTNSAITVSNGLFTTTIDFGAQAFNGSGTWLGIAVRTNGSGAFSILMPYQQITPTPYAITAQNLAGVVLNNTIMGINDTIGGGLDNKAGHYYSTIGGGTYNDASGDGSTISGGSFNRANGSYATVNGGQNNIASGYGSTAMGDENRASGDYSTAMGEGSTASGLASTTMGENTVASSEGSTALGTFTIASGVVSTAMGENCTASGAASIAMGALTIAAGDYSFAAGVRAQAMHNGSFVWADSQNVNFTSTTNDQFSIRAQNGVRLNSTDTSLYWGTGAKLWPDQGGAIELGDSLAGSSVPYVDFHYGVSSSQDFNVRLMNDADGQLTLYGNQQITGNLSFGAGTRQMINLYPGNLHAIGVQNATTYFRSSTRFSWFQNGVHANGENDPGTGGTVLMTLNSGGLTVKGTLVSTSDRNAKENFKPVSTQEILNKVAGLPLTRWNYKDDVGTEHLGPMAQDFYAAFAIGPDDKHIAVVDEGGVALAAIQGLNQKLEETRAENASLKYQNDLLADRLNKLEAMMKQFVAQK